METQNVMTGGNIFGPYDTSSKHAIGKKRNFFDSVFNFDENSKTEMLNLVQYTLFAFAPVVALNKLMQKFVPDADEEKGSVEMIVEVLIQANVIFLGLLFIHRAIIFFPTYSGARYPDVNITCMVLPIILIISCLQTKFGEKVNILFERLTEVWDGKKKKKKRALPANLAAAPATMHVSPSLYAGQQQQQQDMGSSSISNLPNNLGTQVQPEYYMGPPSSQADGIGGGGGGMIMAANEALGGGGLFGSQF